MPWQPPEGLKLNEVLGSAFMNDVNKVIIAMVNLIDRSFPKHLSKIPGYQPFLLVTMHTAKTTFDALKYVMADSPPDPHRKVEFGLAVSPNIRLLLDLLFTIIIIRQKPRKMLKWYHRAGWRDIKEAVDRLEAERGHSPKIAEKVKQERAALEYLRKIQGVPPRLAKDVTKIPYWPHPGKYFRLAQAKKVPLRPQRFFRFLTAWFYTEFSQEAHGSASGLIRIYSKLLLEKDEGREKRLALIKSNNFVTAVTLMLAICTEINDIGRFDRRQKLAYLWNILVSEWDDAESIYRRRYRDMLRKMY